MGKSLIRRRREAGATCSKCGSPDYSVTVYDWLPKPVMQCGSCGETWCNGADGGIYGKLAEKVVFVHGEMP